MSGLFACLQAQPVLTPKNVALGGGGSTYITDYNANFYNPANLLIQDRKRSTDFGLMVTGTYFNGVQNFTDIDQQRNNFADYIYAFTPDAYLIGAEDVDEILNNNYVRNRTVSRHQTRFDVTLLGLKWQLNDKAYSIAIRNRISSSFEVGKGWYSDELQTVNEVNRLDRTLRHRYQSLFEVSFGFADNFKFFTDMTPRLDEFTIGVAPKIVLAGPYQQAEWNNLYYQNDNGGYDRTQFFDYQAAGNFGSAVDEYLNGASAQDAVTSNIQDNVFDIYGAGAGVDVGFTYLITYGSDLSTISETRQRTQRSLRVSFAITDIGFVMYNYKGIELNNSESTSQVSNLPTVDPTKAFVGAPGQFLSYIDEFGLGNPFYSATTTREDGDQYVMLPTALHTGILFEINRVKLVGDLSFGLSNTAFNSTKVVASAGIEIRPLQFLPLRAGTQLATELPSFFSFGTGIETRLVDISIATQFVSRTFKDNPTISGVTVAAFQFHF